MNDISDFAVELHSTRLERDKLKEANAGLVVILRDMITRCYLCEGEGTAYRDHHDDIVGVDCPDCTPARTAIAKAVMS